MLRCLILCYQVVEELIAEGQKLIPNGYGQVNKKSRCFSWRAYDLQYARGIWASA
jgi:hypothetical protein